MAQTAFTKTILPSPSALTGIAVTMAACDATNGNVFAATGTEIMIVMNSSTVSAETFAITGVADPFGRTSNFSMSVPASGSITAPSIIVTPRLSAALWASSGNVLMPSSNNAALLVGVLTGT